MRDSVRSLVFFDTGDSAGWLLPRVLPYVRRYYKSQLFKDRTHYRKRLYGYRAYSDYYHTKLGVEDESPTYSEPVNEPAFLERLGISWNSGLANYSIMGIYRAELYRYLPIAPLLSYPQHFTPATANRPRNVSCRMGISYDRASVAHQRQQIKLALRHYSNSAKLSRRTYFAEMRESKIVMSPFGWGEITLKDFEVFICGALLVKPDMSHMQTFPDFFQDGHTIISHSWDTENIADTVQSICLNYDRHVEIAKSGQALYRKYVATEEGYELFCDHFEKMLQESLR